MAVRTTGRLGPAAAPPELEANMIDRLRDLPAGIDGLRAKGRITREDYETVVQPICEEARSQGRRIRFLYHLGPEFEGFTAGGAWEDARLGLRYLRLFERCAIVSDIGWVRESSRLVGAIMPCPVKVFSNREWQDALAWLSTPATEGGAVAHRLLPESGVLVVEPERPLRAEDFDALALTVDPWIEAHGELRGVVIHAREFPGWENLGALLRHLRFVRDHHRLVRRIALAAGGKLADLAPRLAEHFVAAEVRHFDYDDVDRAIAWASARGDK
jgi:hypothetical protein